MSDPQGHEPEKETRPRVAKAAYEQVIRNGIGAVELLPRAEALDYLARNWLPFAREVLAESEADRAA